MLKKMLLFIAISSSFLPVLGETNEQRIEALEKKVAKLEQSAENLKEIAIDSIQYREQLNQTLTMAGLLCFFLLISNSTQS